jgi:putative ABC transport system substrate-binding protein
MMQRRAFIVAVAGLLGPVSGAAQTPVLHLGILLFGTPDTDPNLTAFRQGLAALGYVEARNLAIQYRYAAGQGEKLRDLATELVALKPDVILALGGDVAPFVRAATTSIPIVAVVSNDPLQSGLVASLARPTGNVTGCTFVSSDLAAKRLQLLKDMAPRVSRVGILWNPDHVDPEYRETQRASKDLGVQLQSLEVRSIGDFSVAFTAAIDGRAEAVVAVSSRLMTSNRQRIIDFTNEHRLVLASGWGPWAKEGALFSYGPDLDTITRRAAHYVDRIFRGAKPADLPIEQPTKFDLTINLRTARALGLTVPPGVLARADEIIQ